MNILVTGGTGMLATELSFLDRGSHHIVFLDKHALDITDPLAVDSTFQSFYPHLIINCAAYTQVDNAEDIGKNLNFKINCRGVYVLAQAAKKYGADFITFSTDYVFDGMQSAGYTPYDQTNPLNNYGLAKDLGEKLCHDIYPESIIIRTSRLYGGTKDHKNFVATMLRLSEVKTELRVIDDQWGNPTYAGDLALAVKKITDMVPQLRGLLLHLTNETGGTGITRYQFASHIFDYTRKQLVCLPITTDEYKTKAVRPQRSILLNNCPDLILPGREDGLKRFITTLGG